MKFVTNTGKEIEGVDQWRALSSYMLRLGYFEFKVYWDGRKPYVVPYAGSKHKVKAYRSTSKLGQAFLNAGY